MPMTTIPYARQRAYDDDGYVTRMSDLMMRRAAAEQDAIRQQGAVSAARWAGAGNVITTSLADIAKQRDYRKQLELRASEREQERADRAQQRDDMLSQREADNAFRDKTYAEQVAERGEARKYREQQDRFNQARDSAEDVQPNAELSPYDYEPYRGTPSARRFRYNAPMDERLPATSMMDTAGMAGYADAMNEPVESAPESAGVQPFTWAEERAMSGSTDARPESYSRIPSGPEQLAIENAANIERARREAAANALRDDQRALAAQKATDADRVSNRAYQAARLAQGRLGGEPLESVIGEDGEPVLVPRSQARGRRPGATREQPTEDERKSVGFHRQMEQAIAIMDVTEDQLTETELYQIQTLPQEELLGAMNRGNMSEAAKRYLRAFEQFTEARMRPISGAAINDSEYARDRRTYARQYSETEALRGDRISARQGALETLQMRAGRAFPKPKTVVRDKDGNLVLQK